MARKVLTIRTDFDQPAMTMHRSRLWCDRFVYVITCNRKQRYSEKGTKYKHGGSRILKIGVTGQGKKRPAGSMASAADKAFNKLRGVRFIRVHLLKCGKRRNVQSWKQLESALIRRFYETFGALPRFNAINGVKLLKRSLFRAKRLDAIIDELS
jgi:hypothetical protein